jgi:D-alanine-D-alanine ligase
MAKDQVLIGEAKAKEKGELAADPAALKKITLVAVAHSAVAREMFATREAYEAEYEVVERAADVLKEIEKLGVPAKTYPGDPYLLTNLLVDKPNFVLNLVDTLKGKDSLQTSVPAALELSNIPYTGAGMEGLVIGNNRNLIKHLLISYQIDTPEFQFIRRAGTTVDEKLGLPLIVKLNESGGSVGIDNKAVQETMKDAQKKVDDMITTYKLPVVVERFIDGVEIMAEKIFRTKPDGKHEFTSFESYEDAKAYKYKLTERVLEEKIAPLTVRAFNALSFKDYAKFDIRVDEKGTPYFTDCNPNTAFGPDKGLPFTEVLALHGVSFTEILTSLLSKYAKNIPS